MKKLLASSILCINALAISIGVSIEPQAQIVKKLLPSADVIVLLPKGSDPHTYEPKPKQLLQLSKSEAYLGIGVEIEDVWLKKLEDNTKIKIFHTDKNIKKYSYSNVELIQEENEHHKHDNDHEHHDHDHHHHGHDHHHDHLGLDVHIWTEPFNIKKIAINSANALKEIAPNYANEIDKNLALFKEELDELNLKIYDLLKDVKVRGFISAHPSWGYFAKRYDLEEYTLELDGKELKPNDLLEVIKVAKEGKACLILNAPQFNNKLVKVLENESKLKVVQVDPLAKDFLQELDNFAKIIKNNCSYTNN